MSLQQSRDLTIYKMAHLIDNQKGFNAFASSENLKAWHGLGQKVSGNLTTAQALELGGLDFQVEKFPNIHRFPNGIEIVSEKSFFTARMDTNFVLGANVGSSYSIWQNNEMIEIVDRVLDSGTASIATVGSISDGCKVFVCLKLNENFGINSDSTEQYVLICNSHDGSLAVTAKFTNVRVVCNNTLTSALQGKSDVKIKHTTNKDEKITEAMKLLKLIKSSTAENQKLVENLHSRKINQETFYKYVLDLYSTPAEISELKKGSKFDDVYSTRKKNIINGVLDFSLQGVGQKEALNGGEINAYWAYNAVNGIVTRTGSSDASIRANSLLFGADNKFLSTALECAMVLDEKPTPLFKTNFSNN